MTFNFPQESDIPKEFQITEPIHIRQYLIGGELHQWTGDVQEVLSPIYINNGNKPVQKLLGSYPLIGEKEALQALAAAEKAYNYGRGVWPTMGVAERIKCAENFVKKMVGFRSHVVKLLMWEIGKSLADSEKEFDRTVEYIFNTIEELKSLDRISSGFKIEQGVIGQIRRSPLGIVLCMGPFNYPLNETYTMLIPALMMGNVVMFKPPRQGILLNDIFQEAYRDCFPSGAINFLYGRGTTVVPCLMSSGKVDVLTLIGSSRMADRLQKMHPKLNRLRSVLGLDAKNAAIVMPNADLDVAVKECLLGSLSFNGQRCTAIKIIFIHRSLVENFLEKFNAGVTAMKVGMPWEKGVAITPVAEPEKPNYLKTIVDDAIAKGAKVINEYGGENLESFYFPAVVYPVSKGMTLYTEEQFGPVVPIVAFDNPEETIQYLIESNHGQQVSIFDTDPKETANLIDHLVNQVSRVNINAQCQRGPDTFPFTGRKDSAQGTLSVNDALRSFSIRTVVATKDTGANKNLINTIVTDDMSHFLSTRFIF